MADCLAVIQESWDEEEAVLSSINWGFTLFLTKVIRAPLWVTALSPGVRIRRIGIESIHDAN